MQEFIIATNNPHKLIELDRILNPLGIKAVTARSKGVDLSKVEETGATFSENAYLKAKAAFDLSGCPAIADDSGLCIDALGGRPGVYSARYGGEDTPHAVKNAMILQELDGVPEASRGAHFTCSICCILEDGSVIAVEDSAFGTIAFAPSGEGGFGYDPIFIVEKKSFAELPPDEKDALSHRGKALRKLRDELSKHFETEVR